MVPLCLAAATYAIPASEVRPYISLADSYSAIIIAIIDTIDTLHLAEVVTAAIS